MHFGNITWRPGNENSGSGSHFSLLPLAAQSQPSGKRRSESQVRKGRSDRYVTDFLDAPSDGHR